MLFSEGDPTTVPLWSETAVGDNNQQHLPPPPPRGQGAQTNQPNHTWGGGIHLLEERVEVIEHRLAPGPLADAVTVERVGVVGRLF